MKKEVQLLFYPIRRFTQCVVLFSLEFRADGVLVDGLTMGTDLGTVDLATTKGVGSMPYAFNRSS